MRENFPAMRNEKKQFIKIKKCLTVWGECAILLLPLKGFIFLCKNLAGQLPGQAFLKRISLERP